MLLIRHNAAVGVLSVLSGKEELIHALLRVPLLRKIGLLNISMNFFIHI